VTRTIGLILLILIIVLCLPLTPVMANGSKPSAIVYDSPIDVPASNMPVPELPDFNSLHSVNAGSNCNNSNSMSPLNNRSILTSAAVGGTPWAWGYNNYGQLGKAPTLNVSTTPIEITGLENVIAIASGSNHSLALKSDSTVWAWGYNNFGQLGNGTAINSLVPFQVSSLNGIIAIAGGQYHSLALKSDGTVWTWGYNYYGQLGSRSTDDSSIPVQVRNVSGVIAIAGGYSHSLALKSDGTVWVWGSNSKGQLGIGSTNKSSGPVQLSGLSGVTAIAGGFYHSLALKSDGTVWAWGYNQDGQLGDGSTNTSYVPVQVNGLNSVIAIAGGSDHSLALKSDGTVCAWGYNGYGQLGNGTTDNSSVPVQVTGLNGITAIAGGSAHNLALGFDGTAWDWGYNYYGQLGNGTTNNSPVPVQVTNINSVTTIAAGSDHSLALKSDGQVWAWGSKYFGQLGNGDAGGIVYPSPVSNLTGEVAVAGGDGISLALKSDGTVWAWGYNNYGQLGNGTTVNSYIPVQASGLNSVIAIATGGHHSLALKSDGTVWFWGLIDFLSKTAYFESTPFQKSNLNNVMAISCGYSHSLALKSDGSVWAWGEGIFGQLGNGSTNSSEVPVQVNGLNSVIAIAAGSDHNLALKSDGTVWAWGYNNYGQLGNGIANYSTVPVQVSSLNGITAIAAGSDHSLALKANGTVWAWGYNNYGQLGNGSTNNSYVPVQVNGLIAVTTLAGGGSHSLALKSDGRVWAWGWNEYGQLGNGITINSSVPVQVSTLSSVIAIAAGNNHSLVLLAYSPIAPSPILPADGATVRGNSVTFQWAESDGATNYWLAVVKASDNSVLVNKPVGNVTSDTEMGFPNDGTVCKWVVAAGNGAGWGSASTPRTFMNGSAVTIPLAPTLTSPADEGSVSGTSITFQWSPSPGATNYWLAVVKASDNSVIINKAAGNVTSDIETGFPNDGTQYRWVVAAGNSFGWSNISAIRTFTNGYAIRPSAPSLISPATGAMVIGTSVTFQWSASSRATNYWLVVKAADNSVIINKAVGNVTSDTETGFPNNGSAYVWIVAAGNSAGWSSPSASSAFTNGTAITMPPAPSLTSPVDGASVSGTSVTFQWSASNGATNYWLAVVKASDNSVIVNKAVGNVTSDTEAGFLNNGTQYRWVVAAGNNSGWGSASTARTFTNGTGTLPSAPSLTYPADGATVSGTSVTFQWAASSGATNYWLALVKVSDNSVIINKAVGNVTSDTETGFPNNGTQYRWVVAAGNNAGWGTASTMRTFTNGP
jgi:alpha-tubulin suppressor-like RCC1 family protein